MNTLRDMLDNPLKPLQTKTQFGSNVVTIVATGNSDSARRGWGTRGKGNPKGSASQKELDAGGPGSGRHSTGKSESWGNFSKRERAGQEKERDKHNANIERKSTKSWSGDKALKAGKKSLSKQQTDKGKF